MDSTSGTSGTSRTTGGTDVPDPLGDPRPDGTADGSGTPPSGPLVRPAHQRFLIWATALFLAAATLFVGARLVGSDAFTPVTQLLAFFPWLLLPVTAALLLTALLRWRAGIVWALVVLAVTGWFVRPYDPGAPGPRGPAVARVEVLTSNVEFGQGTLGLIDAIRREKPDLVFVQECEFICTRLLDTGISRAAYPYRHVVEAGGSEGSAIFSAFPLTDTDGISGMLAMPGSDARIGGRTVRLQLAHPLPPLPGGLGSWRTELGRVRTYAAAHRSGPVILAGDFNATRDHAAFRDILDAGGLRDSAALGGAGRTPSWPAAVPRPLGAQIDHVLVSDDFSVREARFLDLASTDHRSLLVTLDLHAPAPRK